MSRPANASLFLAFLLLVIVAAAAAAQRVHRHHGGAAAAQAVVLLLAALLQLEEIPVATESEKRVGWGEDRCGFFRTVLPPQRAAAEGVAGPHRQQDEGHAAVDQGDHARPGQPVVAAGGWRRRRRGGAIPGRAVVLARHPFRAAENKCRESRPSPSSRHLTHRQKLDEQGQSQSGPENTMHTSERRVPTRQICPPGQVVAVVVAVVPTVWGKKSRTER